MKAYVTRISSYRKQTFLFLCFILTICIVLTGGMTCLAASAGSVAYGDVNGDGKINSADYSLMKRYILGNINDFPVSDGLKIGDVSGDGKINSVDYSLMKRFILGNIDEFPAAKSQTPGVQYIGRFDFSDSAGPKFAWSESTIKANFQGTGISVNLKSSGDNWFNVIVDGVVKTPINVTAGTSASITLASNLTNGNHTIELVKRTEASIGDVQFLGFTVTGGSLMAPPAPSSRRIEFIGDSITCGYGDEGANQNQSFTAKNENPYLAYGALTARSLNADPITVCWSGKGVVRNYGGQNGDFMPTLYPQILAYNSTLLWDTSKWIPQVVVINLGTNDFSTAIPDKNAFTTAYTALLNRVRGQYPDAHIYCAIGPMLYGDALTAVRDCLNTAVNQKNSSGDKKVHYIEFPGQDAANGYGEDWHPSLKTHQIMADQLTAQIRNDLGW